jgi:hypothetical protein
LQGYAEGGGKLIFTGLPGCYDELGRPRNASSVEALVGARFVRRLDSLDNHVMLDRAGEGPIFSDLGVNWQFGGVRPNWPFLVKGPAVIYKPTTARALGKLIQPHRTVRQKQAKEGTDWPMSAGDAVGPAILVNRVGSGTVVTFACSPDYSAASEHHVAEARKLLINAVQFLNPGPLIEITAPANVEAIVTDDHARWTLRVHLIGYNAPAQTMVAQNRPYVQPALMEQPAMYRASITCSFPIRNVTKLNASTTLVRQASVVKAIVEDVHETIVIRY